MDIDAELRMEQEINDEKAKGNEEIMGCDNEEIKGSEDEDIVLKKKRRKKRKRITSDDEEETKNSNRAKDDKEEAEEDEEDEDSDKDDKEEDGDDKEDGDNEEDEDKEEGVKGSAKDDKEDEDSYKDDKEEDGDDEEDEDSYKDDKEEDGDDEEDEDSDKDDNGNNSESEEEEGGAEGGGGCSSGGGGGGDGESDDDDDDDDMDNFDWEDLERKDYTVDKQGVADILVRIRFSSYQSDTDRCKIYSALHNILSDNTDSAVELFTDLSKTHNCLLVIPRISTEDTTIHQSISYLRNCAKENPALTLRKDCKAPSTYPSPIKGLYEAIDFERTDPLYMVRLMRSINESSKDELVRLIAKKSRSVKRRALRVCWDQEAESDEYRHALKEYATDTLYSYLGIKKWFEQKAFRVTEWTGKGVALLMSDGSLKQNSDHDITSTFKDVYYHVKEEGQKEEEEEESTGAKKKHAGVTKKRFINRWLDDPLKRTYTRVDCSPSRTKPLPPDVYNTWAGIRAEGLPPVPEGDVEALIKPVLDHICIVVVDNNEEHLDFILAWFAQMIKFPEQTTCVAILLQGEHGVGKNAPFDFFRDYVLGEKVTFQTSNPAEVFEKHSICRAGKLMIQLDEANGSGIVPLINHLKHAITSTTYQVNPKNGQPNILNNYCNYCFTTNNPNPIPIETSDRRFSAFYCSSIKKDNSEYFDALWAAIQDPRVARAFYQFLMGGDWSAYGCGKNMQLFRPVTDCYMELRRINIPVWAKWLSKACSELIARGVERSVCSSWELNKEFKEWVKENYERFNVTQNTLGTPLGRYAKLGINTTGVTKSRAGGVSKYTFTWDVLKAYMQSQNTFDEEVF